MTQKYYTQENDISSIVDYFQNSLAMKDNEQDDLIKAKIKNLYDYNFLKLFRQIQTFLPINDMKNEELYFFFNKKVYTHFAYESFTSEDENSDDYPIFFYMDYVTLNCKLKVYRIVEKLLNTKKIPIHILVSELFTLKDFIINEILSNLDYVLNSIAEYSKNSLVEINYDYILVSLQIDKVINDHKYNLTNCLDLITLKLEQLTSEPHESNKKNSFEKNYNITLDDKLINKLYNELERNEFIDIFETSYDQFVEVLKKDWHSHKSVIHLKMDNIQIGFFLLNLKKHLQLEFSLSKIELANNIYTKKGVFNARSVSSSFSESKRKGTEPKRKKDIISIFEKLKLQ